MDEDVSEPEIEWGFPASETRPERRWDVENRKKIHLTNLAFLAHSRRKPTATTKRRMLVVRSSDSVQNLACFHVVFFISCKFIPKAFLVFVGGIRQYGRGYPGTISVR